MLQNAAPLRKSAAWPPNIPGEHLWWTCLLYCACHAKRHLNVQKWCEHVVRFCVFSMLAWKCASRHNGVHFFDISTSKSGKNMVCVLYILTSERASRHNCVQFFDMSTVNFQKWSEHWKCASRHNCVHFSTSQLLEAPWSWGVLRILTSKRASRNNGVQCSISYLTTWLRARRFSEPTFRPSWATNHWKNIVFCDFATFRAPLPFAHLHLLSSHSFSSLIFSLLLFSSLTFPTSAFPSVHIVGSLTSKLPSMNAFRCLPGWFAACLTSPCFTLSIVRFSIISLRWQTFTQGRLWNRVLQCFDVGSC